MEPRFSFDEGRNQEAISSVLRLVNSISFWGLILLVGCFVFMPFFGSYLLTQEGFEKVVSDPSHRALLKPSFEDRIIGVEFDNVVAFWSVISEVQHELNDQLRSEQRWNEVIYSDYSFDFGRTAVTGVVREHATLFFWLLMVLGLLLWLIHLVSSQIVQPMKPYVHVFERVYQKRSLFSGGLAVLLIVFYILLYWFPIVTVNWVWMVDDLSVVLSGSGASQWFLYGLMYTLVILVMGVRMLLRYRQSNYQLTRTVSLMFFQLCFAFIIPQWLTALNLPAHDLKNIWPLDYSFFFDYRLGAMMESGTIGFFMLGWGLVLFAVAVPLLTYFFGKRWYCSWVCGCGGLAETAGDPFRHLSDNSLKAWKVERWMVHGVLLLAVVMTAAVLYTYFTGNGQLAQVGSWSLSSYDVRHWYGFAIGAAFAGVVGTGLYPLFGNRVWCRFGCPLAAYLGLIQRFKSRFRITTNGGQCISCGNCSVHCEMGIDVRSYAQRGQNIVRSSCVGCGVCADVCPRGVLKLEVGSDDGKSRHESPAILLGNDGIRLNL